MIVKNCVDESWLEERDPEYKPEHEDSSHLNMKLSIGTIPSPLFQECRVSLWSKEHNSDENYSLSLSLQRDKTMDTVSMRFVEKFSELKLESTDEVKLEDNNAPEATTIASVENCIDQTGSLPDGSSGTSKEHLPTAMISIKEDNRKPLCLSCNNAACSNKSKFNQNEDVTTESFNPFRQSLVSRSPDRNGRQHCKVSPSHIIGNAKSAAKQKTAVCVNDAEMIKFHCNSPADFSAQLLHGSGGRMSELHPLLSKEIKSLCRIDQEISLEQLENCINFIDDPFSPSSVCSISSSAYSLSSPSSVEYLSPSSVNNIESHSGDTRNSSPSISELYPTPPNSVIENISLQTNDYFSEASPDYSTSQFDTNDDSLFMFSFDESLTLTDVPSPFSEKSEHDTFPLSSTQDEINDIVWYLKNGTVSPITAQLVTNCSKSFEDTTDRNYSQCDSASASDKATQKLDSFQNPLTNSHPTKSMSAAALPPSNITSPIYNSGNHMVQPTVLVMPIQLQTVAVSGQKDRRFPREIKPNIHPMEKGIDLPNNEEKCRVVEDTDKINAVCPGTIEYKSVKAKIGSNFTCEEKKKLLKSVLEERTTTDGSTKLHSSAKSGNEKLVYVIIESMRTKMKTENLNSRTDNLNPRISAKEKIQRFVNMQDSLGCTPLYYAAFTENNLLVAYLLESGANPFIKDYKNGNTPYHISTLRGDGAIKLMELLSFKRNVTDVVNNKGQTVLTAAVINHGRTYNGVLINGIKLIKHLLCNNHKLSSQDSEGKTALHMAVLKKDMELLEVLLTCGIDAKVASLVKDKEGNTILHDAALLANYRLIEIIIIRCSGLTEIRNNKGQLPYELINENKKQERKLLQSKFDEYGYRNL